MRIGYTCHDAFPSTTTNTQQVFWTLLEMAALGHRIDLCVPGVRGGADAREVIARHYGSSPDNIPATLQIVPLGRDTDEDAERGRRWLSRAWFDVTAPAYIAAHAHDLMWTRDPLAATAAVRRGVPTVLETYRPDYALAPAFALWRRATFSSPLCVGVITHSRLAADAFVRAGLARDRVDVIHNGFAPALMEPRLSRADARAQLALPDDARLAVYAGHVGPHKGSDALVSLAAAAPEVILVIVGVDAETTPWLEAGITRAGVTNVILRPRVDVRAVAPYLYAADCLLVPPTDAPLRRYGRTVLPMKLFPYMASGTPILAPALPDIEEVLQHERTAVLVPPGDLRATADALRAVIADPHRAARLGLAAQRAAQAFTWHSRARAISSVFERWCRVAG